MTSRILALATGLMLSTAVFAKAGEGAANAAPADGTAPAEGTAPADGTAPEGTALEAAAAAEGGEPADPVVGDGVRARRGLSPKQLVPSIDWIMKNIVGGGKGTKATVGRIYGVVTSAARKQNEFQGNLIDSIVCNGVFNAESFLTGEISQGSSVYLPMAYAEQIATAFAMDKTITAIQIDCDIGLEATGKAIPYEWVTTAFLEGKEMAILKRMRAARARPENLLIGADGMPKQLTIAAK